MTTATSTIDPTAAAAGRTNPFPGLRPFREDEESLFFGRESQVDAMVDKLSASRFLSVVGTSGSGKSSLVNCGLRPALHRGLMADVGTTWRMAQFRPGADPVRAMAGALARDGVLFRNYQATGLTLAEIVETTLRMSRVGLIDIFEQARLDDDVNLLVVVDQFEELFRYRLLQDGGEDNAYGVSEAATAFVNLLLGAREEAGHPIYVVLTMRSDFLGDCAQFPGLAEAVNVGQYLVPRLTRDERRAAIAGPIAVGGSEIEPVLLTRLLNDVGDNPDQLSILQHALNRTWARWQGVGGEGPLRLQHYDDIGTMAHALDRHAERAFNELGSDQERVCEKIFKALTDKATDPRGVRRPTRVRTLCELAGAQEAEVAAVIGVFRKTSRSFLMPPAEETLHPETVVDISHESLMRIWQRLNVWADEEAQSARTYRRLAEQAAEHEAGEASLLRDPELQFALNWRERNQPNESWASRYHKGFEPAMDFLAESERARDRERLMARARVAVLVALVVISAAVGVVAVLKGRDADRQKQAAIKASKAATLLAVTATANDRSITPLGSALLLSLAAYQRNPTFESRRSIVQSLTAAAEQPLQLVLRTHVPARALALSPDGHTVAIADRSGRVRRWDLRTHKSVGPTLHVVDPRSHETTLHPSIAFGPNGTLAEGTDARLTLWVPGEHPVSLRDRGKHINGEVRTVAFSPDGKILASSGFDGLVRLWNVRKHRLLKRRLLGRHPRAVNTLAFSPDGKTLWAGGDGRTIGTWRLKSSKDFLLYPEDYAVNGLAAGGHSKFSYARTLAAAGDDGAIHVWGFGPQKQLTPKRVKNTGRAFVDLAVSADGRRVAGASDDGTVRLWDAGTGKLLLTATSPGSSTSRTVDLERDGRLVSLDADGNITVWSKQPSSFGDSLPGRVPGWPTDVPHPGAPVGITESLPVLAASPDGRHLVGGGFDGLRLWDVKKRKALLIRATRKSAAKTMATAVAFSPDGKLLAEATTGGVRLWRATDLPQLVPAGRAQVGATPLALAFSREGLLAFGGTDGHVYLWDTRATAAKPRLVGNGSDVRNGPDERSVFALAFSPDGTTLASGGWDGTLRLWRVSDASRPKEIGAPDDMKAPSSIRGLAFGPKGRLIAVGSADGTISLWDAAKRKERPTTATPDSDAVESVAFATGGHVLVTAGDDGAVRFWDVGNLRPLGQLVKSHVGKIRRLALSRNGSVLATAQNDGSVRLWPGIVWPNKRALAARICRLVAGGIANAEWKAIIPAGVKQPLPHLCAM